MRKRAKRNWILYEDALDEIARLNYNYAWATTGTFTKMSSGKPMPLGTNASFSFAASQGRLALTCSDCSSPSATNLIDNAGLCGECYPKYFGVSDEEFEKYRAFLISKDNDPII